MRISDWSSDVCSSDLSRQTSGARSTRQPKLARRPRPRRLIRYSRMFTLTEAGHGGTDLPRRCCPSDFTRDGARREIGRASCRERGCQYVEISVVGGSLKKKNMNEYSARQSTTENDK